MTMGVVVLSLFGGVWFEWGIGFLPAANSILAVVPLVVIMASLIARRLRSNTSAGRERRQRARRVFAAASAGEVVILLASFWVLSRTGLGKLAPQIVGLIVALHFVPAAHFVPAPRYFVTSIAILALVGLASVMLPDGALAICIGKATILWSTAASIVFWPPNQEGRVSSAPGSSRASDGPSNTPGNDG